MSAEGCGSFCARCNAKVATENGHLVVDESVPAGYRFTCDTLTPREMAWMHKGDIVVFAIAVVMVIALLVALTS